MKKIVIRDREIMKIRIELYPAILLVVFMLLLSFPQTLLSQEEERLAVVSDYEGEVRIKHDGEWKTVTKIGNRIRNSSVYSNDTVLTMPGSTADLVFDDNTRLEVNEDTTLTISTRQIAEEERRQEDFIRRVADTQQDTVRNVNVHIGKIWANITPSKSVLTEFETPTGVASIRGTILTIEFSGGVTTIDLIQGLLGFMSAENEMRIDFNSGDVVNISEEKRKLDVEVESGAITLETSKGTLTIEDGGSLDVIINPETGEMEVKASDGVTITIETEDGSTTTTEVDTETILGTIPDVSHEVIDVSAAIQAGAAPGVGGDPVDSFIVGDTLFMGEDDLFIGGDGLFLLDDDYGLPPGLAGVSLKDFANSSEGDVTKGIREQTLSVPTDWSAINSWTDKQNAYTDTVFGSFTDPGANSVSTNGTLQFNSVESFGSFAVLHTAFDENNGFLKMNFTVASVGSLQTIFDYNFITGEFGSGIQNDAFVVKLIKDDGSTRVLLREEAYFSTLTSTDNLPEDTMDKESGGATGWLTYDQTYTVPAGLTTLLFDISDAGDKKVDSSVLLDNIGAYFTPAPPTVAQVHSNWTVPDAWDADRQNAYTTNNFFSDTTGSGIAPGLTTSKDTGTAQLFETFGNNANFAVVHTGKGDAEGNGYLKVTFDFGFAGNLQTIFNYNFVTTETGGTDDAFVVKLVTAGHTEQLLRESTLSSTLTDVTGTLPTDTLDKGSGWNTGWKLFDKTYTIPDGVITLLFDVTDDFPFWAPNLADEDSASLLDNIGVYFTAADDVVQPQISPQDWVPSGWTAVETWTKRQNAYTTNTFGPINPPTAGTPKNDAIFTENFGTNDGGANNFAVIHTGLGDNANTGYLEWQFTVADGGETRQISFDYNFVTTELPIEGIPGLEFLDGRNDFFKAELIKPDETVVELARESVFESVLDSDYFTEVSGLPSDTFDFTDGWQTGWLSFTTDDDTTEVIEGIDLSAGTYTLLFSVFDAADSTADPALAVGTAFAEYDSAVLLDNVIDPPLAASSTDYLLTFARMLSGEIDIHDADLEADAVASEEHQAFIARVNEVISDMENISVSEFIEGKDEFFDRLWTAREIVAGHEETTEFTQQTAVAHHLLEATVMTNQGLSSSNITAIQDSLNQAKTFLVAHINDFGETDALASIKTNINSVLANIDNMNNNEYTTATIVAIRDGIKQAFSDTINHMSGVCNDPTLPCYTMSM